MGIIQFVGSGSNECLQEFINTFSGFTELSSLCIKIKFQHLVSILLYKAIEKLLKKLNEI